MTEQNVEKVGLADDLFAGYPALASAVGVAHKTQEAVA